MLKRAVKREFEIIGEAMNIINNIDPEIYISSKFQNTGFRNRVVHGYDNIDDEIIWGTIIRYLPNLKKEIIELMKQ